MWGGVFFIVPRRHKQTIESFEIAIFWFTFTLSDYVASLSTPSDKENIRTPNSKKIVNLDFLLVRIYSYYSNCCFHFLDQIGVIQQPMVDHDNDCQILFWYCFSSKPNECPFTFHSKLFQILRLGQNIVWASILRDLISS